MRLALSGWIAAALLLPGAGVGFAQNPGVEPQIVRVSFVQGDVRVSRGRDAEKQTHAEWEQAAVDLPIEEGCSLVTGAGRAELEFEDTSVAYLAENSVVVFNNLETVNGVPQTELALLSGAITIAGTPMVAGERFVVRTPTDAFTLRYPDRVFLRINSYLDGTTLTSMRNTVLRADHGAQIQTVGGQTIAYSHGQPLVGDKLADKTSYAEFDQWVLQQETTRDTAMAETMKQAGLNRPVPGLAQLQGQGHFYACPPYGTCWEPTNGFAGQTTDAEKAAMAQQTVSVKTLAQGGPNSVPNTTSAANQRLLTSYDDFPCSPFQWSSTYQIDPATGRKLLLSRQVVPMGYGLGAAYPYQWAVCHTGSWIRNHGRYAWVTGTKRHHHPPVHWVKSGRAVGYVPIHPHDVAGKPPLNLKDGFFHPLDKSGSKIEVMAYNASAPVKLLAEAPREFLKESYVPLAKAEAPSAEAHLLKPSSVEAKDSGTPITFDHKTQSFMVARQGGSAAAGGNNRMEPIGGHGSDLQAHAVGGSEMSRGPSGGSASGSSTRSDSGSSGSSSSSGASHASAPSSAPAASSSSSSGSSSAGSSSSGGRH